MKGAGFGFKFAEVGRDEDAEGAGGVNIYSPPSLTPHQLQSSFLYCKIAHEIRPLPLKKPGIILRLNISQTMPFWCSIPFYI